MLAGEYVIMENKQFSKFVIRCQTIMWPRRNSCYRVRPRTEGSWHNLQASPAWTPGRGKRDQLHKMVLFALFFVVLLGFFLIFWDFFGPPQWDQQTGWPPSSKSPSLAPLSHCEPQSFSNSPWQLWSWSWWWWWQFWQWWYLAMTINKYINMRNISSGININTAVIVRGIQNHLKISFLTSSSSLWG